MLSCFLAGPANPSSQHQFGQRARAWIDDAVDRMGTALGTQFGRPGGPRLVFTSGGTESNNLALRGIGGNGPLVVSTIEHSSILATARVLERQGREVRWLQVDQQGEIDLKHLEHLLLATAERPSLVSVMSANNETGVVQPVDRIAALCQSAGVPLHLDATQTVGKLPCSLDLWGAAAVSFTAHKFHGPTGIGALWLNSGQRPAPLLFGGEQQLETRPGTEPVPLIVGMSLALSLAADEASSSQDRVRHLRDRLESGLLERFPELVVQGVTKTRLPGTTCISFLGADRQAMLMALDLAGICCSSGSACSSGSSPPSHVLSAMKRPEEEIRSTMRFAVSKFSTMEEVDLSIDAISSVYSRLRRKISVDKS
jgi:cysteine desulfurase